MLGTDNQPNVAEIEREACLIRGYELSDVYLGGGSIGRVFLATANEKIISSNMKLQLIANLKQSVKVAIKMIYADVGAREIMKLAKYVPAEIAHMNFLFGHSNIVMLLDVFISCKRIFLVMEYAARGSLKDLYQESASQSKEFAMAESEARYYFREIARAVRAMHDKKIAHRDMKLDNILITKKGEIKIGDFGFSIAASSVTYRDIRTSNDKVTSSARYGTPAFMAPEVLLTRMKSYDAMKADIWSLGVILFLLVSGRYPFAGKTVKDVLNKMKDWRNGILEFHTNISAECKDLIKKLLSIKPQERYSIHGVLFHPWLDSINLDNNQEPEKIKLDEEQILKIQQQPERKYEEKYVQSYLLQRAELLSRNFKLLNQYQSLPAVIAQQFSVSIPLPQRQGEALQDEVWRLFGEIKNNDNRDTSLIKDLIEQPNYGLPFQCRWGAVEKELPAGYEPALRVIRNNTLLETWRQFCLANKPPRTTIEKCFQLYNTVELCPNKGRLSIPRPSHQYVMLQKTHQKSSNFDPTQVININGTKMVLEAVDYDSFVDFDLILVRCVVPEAAKTYQKDNAYNINAHTSKDCMESEPTFEDRQGHGDKVDFLGNIAKDHDGAVLRLHQPFRTRQMSSDSGNNIQHRTKTAAKAKSAPSVSPFKVMLKIQPKQTLSSYSRLETASPTKSEKSLASHLLQKISNFFKAEKRKQSVINKKVSKFASTDVKEKIEQHCLLKTSDKSATKTTNKIQATQDHCTNTKEYFSIPHRVIHTSNSRVGSRGYFTENPIHFNDEDVTIHLNETSVGTSEAHLTKAVKMLLDSNQLPDKMELLSSANEKDIPVLEMVLETLCNSLEKKCNLLESNTKTSRSNMLQSFRTGFRNALGNKRSTATQVFDEQELDKILAPSDETKQEANRVSECPKPKTRKIFSNLVFQTNSIAERVEHDCHNVVEFVESSDEELSENSAGQEDIQSQGQGDAACDPIKINLAGPEFRLKKEMLKKVQPTQRKFKGFGWEENQRLELERITNKQQNNDKQQINASMHEQQIKNILPAQNFGKLKSKNRGHASKFNDISHSETMQPHDRFRKIWTSTLDQASSSRFNDDKIKELHDQVRQNAFKTNKIKKIRGALSACYDKKRKHSTDSMFMTDTSYDEDQL